MWLNFLSVLFLVRAAPFTDRMWTMGLPIALAWLPAMAAAQLPVIDAHSQFDHTISPQHLVKTLREADVQRVLLATRGRAELQTLTGLARQHPGCVVPMVRSKSNAYTQGTKGYYRQLEEQLAEPEFKAMAELILTHNQKGNRADEVYLPAAAPQVQAAVGAAKARQWPVVLHYEFRWIAQELGAAELQAKLAELRSVLRSLAPLPVGLTHVAQLDAVQARALLQEHPNLFLLLSHANSLINDGSKQPWTNVVESGVIGAEWVALMQQYPRQFVLALDNVFPEHWSSLYAQQVALWRQALGALGPELARAIAHDNAVRIYRLEPAAQGCSGSVN